MWRLLRDLAWFALSVLLLPLLVAVLLLILLVGLLPGPRVRAFAGSFQGVLSCPHRKVNVATGTEDLVLRLPPPDRSQDD